MPALPIMFNVVLLQQFQQPNENICMKKNYLLLLLAAFVFAFSSCSDDDEKSFNSKELEGAWKMTSMLENKMEMLDPDDDIVWIFDDGEFEIVEDGMTDETGYYRVKGDKLIMEGDDDVTFTIEDLTKSKLVLSIKESFGGNTYEGRITFRKN